MSSLDWSKNWEDGVRPHSLACAVTARPPPSGAGWTDSELAEIERLKEICSDHNDWRLECDETDSGDPWVILYDRTQELTVLHLTRIDRRYIAVLPTQARSRWTATLRSAVDIVLNSVA